MSTTDMAQNNTSQDRKDLNDTDAAAADPMWYKDAIIYQTHVKAFGDSNGDGIGDFRGLTERLDYIQQLGVNTVWILPFYPSPQRDDGYDIAGYTDVHPDYGSMEDCREFIAEAHARELRVVTELIINHTSDQHPWFQAARRAPRDSEERNFYVWSDDDSVYSQSRIIFTDTETSNWSWDPLAKQYYWHRFFSHQPDLNFDNPKVLEAVLEIMRFWLALGVDGLRLDAIPYLIEREGTSCENLPETHDVLKKIRAELDTGFPGRMLLAEANQWPEDVREYFADGDECHMAYHFPVMPRMYMAVAQEDRHPIIDIMGQTPEIPDNCQWAIFLRNHDELTLEMVTDRERDYMYRTYAHDPRMRINVGIRRRLAPLLDNDMGKIKLMNGLLLSLLGTPVLYYGDEIGMGDNIYLGDRNGVRTPMQWSPDRNAGFSRADPQRLYLPPVMDPSYGYEAVNVEAQSRSPGSLLNWMRRMIAVRKQHSAFGRGGTRFLGPANRRILAYLREHTLDDGTANVILCVANLSRSPQPVELNLSEFEGYVPIELTGRTPFPRIGALPYLLTLPGHDFYWFQMTENADEPAWLSDIAPVQELPLLVMASGLETLLSTDEQAARQETTDKLQQRLIELLPAFLSGQRWFAAKNEALSRVSLDRICLWQENDQRWLLVWVGVEFENMPPQQYFLPLSIVWDDAADDLVAAQRGSVLARIRQHARMGVICDAYVDPAFCRALAAAMAQQRRVAFDDGELRFWRSSDFAARLGFEEGTDDALLGTACHELDVDIPAVQGSNSAVILRRATETDEVLTEHTAVTDDVDGGSAPRLFLKSYRRLQQGVNPELEMGRFLTGSSSFQNAAPLAGAIEFVDAQANTAGLAIVQGHMPNQGDAWTYTQSYLERLFEDHLAQLARDNTDIASVPAAAVDDGFCELMATLGQRTAEMHQAFAGASADNVDFAPRPISAQDITFWGDDITGSVHAALDKLQTQQELLATEWSSSLDTLLSSREALLVRVRAWVDAAAATPATTGLKIRHHGDLHLGQVLIDRNDFIIIDFEGEPSRSLAERRARHSALKDVAGMLRSFDYAAATALQRARELWPEAAESFAPVLDDWQQQCNRAFVVGYRKVGAADALWNDALLSLLMMDKALYELRYELDHRPGWVHVPLQGLLRLMDTTDTMV